MSNSNTPRQSKSKLVQNSVTEFNSNSSAVISPITDTTTSYGNTTTIITDNDAIYIPAFLKILPSDYVLGKSIASGGFGEIFFLTAKENSELSKLARNKKMVAKRIESAHSETSSFYEELGIMNIFRDHANFIQLIAYDDVGKVIITEFYPVGSILSFWKIVSQSPITHVISLLSGTVFALNEMVDILLYILIVCSIK